mgnify:CR=1 FL=1
MLISHAWLSRLLDLPGPAPAPAQLAAILTGLGLEVESLQRKGDGLGTVIAAEVRACEPHPQAQKLSVVQLWDGQTTVQVVCGASNVPAPGGKVAFAPVGTRLPDGLEIAARELRGVASHGMICSETELDVGSDDSGILILPPAFAPGSSLTTLVPGVEDTILEVAVTANRPDALGHIGVARDVAAKLRGTLRLPPVRTVNPLALTPRPELVTISAGDRCGRYMGYVLEDATVAASPLWLRVCLHRLGLRAISNVVDVTNYVLLEAGQPLHAFDRAKLAEGRVVVRLAAPREQLTLLDGKPLALDEQDLVIADATRPQALAGVMGGADSAVSAASRELLLEAAWFAPRGIRASARRHGLASDSSYRFERGVDHGAGLGRAALRAENLLEDLTGARCTGHAEAVGERPARRTIDLRPARAEALLGVAIPDPDARAILRSLEVAIDDHDKQTWRCEPPSHRPDLQREVDLIEELMRHRGLEHIPARASVPAEARRAATCDPLTARGDRLAEGLMGAGLHEVVSLAFVAESKLALFPEVAPDRRVRVTNPMRGADVMRTHLLPGLLDALAHNVARHIRPVRLFELGRTYAWPEGILEPAAFPAATRDIDVRLPVERSVAAMLLHTREGSDPRVLTGAAAHALSRLGLRLDLSEGSSVPWLHPGVQVRLLVGAVDIGFAGEVHPDVIAAWDLPPGTRVAYAEIDIHSLPASPVALAREIARFPATSRDLSLEIPVTLPASVVVAALRSAVAAAAVSGEDPPRLDEAIDVLEDYRGAGVPADHRALLLRLHYGAAGRTVTDAEVQALHAAIVEHACADLRRRAPTVHAR